VLRSGRPDTAILLCAATYNFLMPSVDSPSAQAPVVHEQLLENGLRVLVQQVLTAPLASVWCWYKVGSRDESAGMTGVSHWVEHMNFKGTTNIPRDKVKGIIEKHGGYWNGYTWIDQTTYTETATCDALDHMLFIEAERMANCLYDPADCDSERTVIISELQGGENDPDTLLDQELTTAAFRAHPYRHPTIGWLADLERMSREDLYGYYRRFYVPNNATLVIVGDVDAAEVIRGAETHFGKIAPRELPERIYTREPAQLGERRVKVSKPGTTGYLKVGFHAPSAFDPDFFPLLALDAILTGAKGLNLWASFRTAPPQRSARLYQKLVNGGLASVVSGGLVPTADPFLYTISLTATEGTPLASLEAPLIAELDRVRSDGVTARELSKAKNQLRARLVFENDSISNIAHQLGFFETLGSWRAYTSIPSRIEAVTVDQVADVAARRLHASNRTVGWFEPLPSDSDEQSPAGEGAGAGPASR
jgi:zinc protease